MDSRKAAGEFPLSPQAELIGASEHAAYLIRLVSKQFPEGSPTLLAIRVALGRLEKAIAGAKSAGRAV